MATIYRIHPAIGIARVGNSPAFDNASNMLLTRQFDFTNIPQEPMGMMREPPLDVGIVLHFPRDAIALEYAPGGAPTHAQLVARTSTVTVDPTRGAAYRCGFASAVAQPDSAV